MHEDDDGLYGVSAAEAVSGSSMEDVKPFELQKEAREEKTRVVEPDNASVGWERVAEVDAKGDLRVSLGNLCFPCPTLGESYRSGR
jgi:hypothetical protein